MVVLVLVSFIFPTSLFETIKPKSSSFPNNTNSPILFLNCYSSFSMLNELQEEEEESSSWLSDVWKEIRRSNKSNETQPEMFWCYKNNCMLISVHFLHLV